jgi:hypothetical protein
MGSRKISKTKFLEAMIQKILEELDKADYSGLVLTQNLKAIKSFILNFFPIHEYEYSEEIFKSVRLKS